jgi:hypothetical protein
LERPGARASPQRGISTSENQRTRSVLVASWAWPRPQNELAPDRNSLAGSSKTRQLRCIQISTMTFDRTEWISLTVALAGLLTALILVYLSLTATAKTSANSRCLASHIVLAIRPPLNRPLMRSVA